MTDWLILELLHICSTLKKYKAEIPINVNSEIPIKSYYITVYTI